MVDYDFSDDWMGYASFARGYKAGGFNLDRGGLRFPRGTAFSRRPSS